MFSYCRLMCVVLFLLLSGCAPDVDGHYLGYVSVLFGLVRARVDLRVDGETALLRWPDGSRLALQATRHGDRLVLADIRGNTLTFHIVDQGETLRCAQCRAVQLPETWERQVREPPTGAAVQPKRPHPAASAMRR